MTMTPYALLKAAGLPAGRNAALDYSDRFRVAEYYGYSTDSDQRIVESLRLTAPQYDDYRVVRSRGGVHALPDGKIRIESREESDYNHPIQLWAKRPSTVKRFQDETLTKRQQRIERVKSSVRRAWEGMGNIERAAKSAARLWCRLEGKPPWGVRESVYNRTYNASAREVVDHDNARQNQEAENRELPKSSTSGSWIVSMPWRSMV